MNKKERKQIEEGDKKREINREKRLQKIQRYLTGVLNESSPENADKYNIVYKPITSYPSNIHGGESKVSYEQSPAYGFFLTPKSSRRKGYGIMHLFKDDIDKKVSDHNIKTHYQIPAFRSNIVKGIEHLQTEKTKKKKTDGLEGTLGIIIILGLFSGIFFISNSVTGFIIANLKSSASNKIGISLIFISLIVAFFWFKMKR